MYVTRKFNKDLINKNRLLGIYLSLIIDLNKEKSCTYGELQKKVKEEFDYDASLDEISNYFEPNFYENRLDVEQQMKNLGIKYD